MKKILGLDLGTNSIGWAFVNEAESKEEHSKIIKLGVRVNPLTVDELTNFEKGKSITTAADRTLKRSMRRNLQRYKLRRENLIKILKENGFITDETILSENGNKTTFETYRLRAKAAVEKISLEDFARVLLMINKKRGYKSSRKAKSTDEGSLIDGMEVAKKLYNENLTPSQLCLDLIKAGKKYLPEFYRSDLQSELDKVWEYQKQFHIGILTDEFKEQIAGKGKQNTSKIFLGKYKIYTADNKGKDKRLQAFQWRVDALKRELTLEELAFVITEINGSISNSSGYLGAISDRSKELYFQKLTVGQMLMHELDKNPHYSLVNQVFYRQDYLDEFEKIWETQNQFHSQLTDKLKKEIRDVVIFYQRRLKSQKGLISFCEFESRQIEVEIDGKKKIKTTGYRVCPRSSPLFQEFKIWQILNNIEIKHKDTKVKRIKTKKKIQHAELFEVPIENQGPRFLFSEEKEILFKELSYQEKLSGEEVLQLLFENYKELEINYKFIEGNKTQATFFKCYQDIIVSSGHKEYDFSKMRSQDILKIVENVFKGLGYNTDILHFNSSIEGDGFHKQQMYLLWHLLYAFEGDSSNTGIENLLKKICKDYGFEKEYATILANINLQDDYSSLSAKAIRKILPYLKEGNSFDVACMYAGYRHSKLSLSKEELDEKILKDKLEILPKNSLRNPVVEKILNQMVNVVNGVIEAYGKPDEIRIELARELKKNAAEREEMTKRINSANEEHDKLRKMLQVDFGFTNVSRNDIIRYKLYEELKDNGYKTIYSNTYIPREKIFSKEFDIEHIIPQTKLFDDSFSNKTLEKREVNMKKSNSTAYDFVLEEYGERGLEQYLSRIDNLLKLGKISITKVKKLKMKEADIPSNFIERDLRDSQYIAKKAKNMLLELVREVVSTTGSITDRLREDWQLIDVMQELNWDKYNELGLTEIIEGREGQRIRRIKDWTKRNDHRHHAMDALTIAFTKRQFIQYLNNLHARRKDENLRISNTDKEDSEQFSITTEDVKFNTRDVLSIEKKELYRDERNKLRFKPPIPLYDFRNEAKKQLENTLISIKAKNKVVTQNINSTKKKGGTNKKVQLTPRGQLHLETVYGSSKKYVVKEVNVNANFTEEIIAKVAKKNYREALLKRLQEFGNDTKKAFTGKNTLDKNPIFLDALQTQKVPQKVGLIDVEIIYTIRKEINKDLNVEKVVDVKIKYILQERLKQFDNDPKKAFSNLDENPIWLNKEKGIKIKRVTISGISNAEALHEQKDKDGKLILDENGNPKPVDFVTTGNNHHVAIYQDGKGDLQEIVVSFYEATSRANLGLPIIDKNYKQNEGWQFLFSMKQNEYFVFPNEKTGLNPSEIDLKNPENYALISPNLFRVQKFSLKNYVFRHHLETSVADFSANLKRITWTDFRSSKGLDEIVKVRINHIGQIVHVGEY